MTTYKIAVIPGDGVGPEVLAEGIKVLQAVAALDGTFSFEFETFPWGCEYYLKHGKILRFGYVRDNELAKHPYATSFTYTLSMCNSYATELDRLLIQRDDFRVRNKTHTDEYNKLELKIKQP